MPRRLSYDPWLYLTVGLLVVGGILMVGSTSHYVAARFGQPPQHFGETRILLIVRQEAGVERHQRQTHFLPICLRFKINPAGWGSCIKKISPYNCISLILFCVVSINTAYSS